LCYSGVRRRNYFIPLLSGYISHISVVLVSVLVWLCENGTENYSAWSSVGICTRVTAVQHHLYIHVLVEFLDPPLVLASAAVQLATFNTLHNPIVAIADMLRQFSNRSDRC